ncbi:MAG: hypothetical protein RL346_1567 [Verrucomicrobiota bacterium]
MVVTDCWEGKSGMKYRAPNIRIGDCARRKACQLTFRSCMKEKYLRLVRKSYRMLKHKSLRDRPWWRAMTRPLFDRQLWVPCRDTVAIGLSIGFFFSMILFLPFQMLFAAVVAMRFRVNVPFAMLACWTSNFFTNVPLGMMQVALGNWMRNSMGFPMPDFLTKVKFTLPEIGEVNAASFLLGMIVSGVLLSMAAFPVVHLFSAIMPHHLPVLKRRAKPVRRLN